MLANKNRKKDTQLTLVPCHLACIYRIKIFKMKLDVNVLRYLGKDDFRTLTAVEMGQKNVRLSLDAHILLKQCP